MARIVPSDIARLEMAGANRHEIETLRLLQARLPDSYTVFHGVHWTREWPGETVFGELDFVVVNQAGTALLIEQKDGTLEDPDQNLRDQRSVDLPGFVGYRARANYRSPHSIARFIRRALPFEFEAMNALPGLGVGVTQYDAPGDQPRLVAKVIGDLLGRGFSHSQIAVLTTITWSPLERHGQCSTGAPGSATVGCVDSRGI